MPTSGDAARALAERLRRLRKSQWPDIAITQKDLALALDKRKPASVQLISSWERTAQPTPPPEDRLDAIATFFSTRRSVAELPYRLIDEGELTEQEIKARDDLRAELLELRNATLVDGNGRSIVGHGPWHYPGGPVVIVCAELPGTDQPSAGSDPDRAKLSLFADLDSLFELHGHVRAVNPDLEVQYRGATKMREDDWNAHVILLGGVDWNEATQDAMRLTGVPVAQLSDDDDPSRGCFQVVEERDTLSFVPQFKERGGERVLAEDVGHFLRAPNPVNRARTITVCNGMYGSGVYGTVRALTDKVFRDDNADYLRRTFTRSTFSLLFRVHVANGKVTTPDWTKPGTVLHKWPEAQSAF